MAGPVIRRAGGAAEFDAPRVTLAIPSACRPRGCSQFESATERRCGDCGKTLLDVQQLFEMMRVQQRQRVVVGLPAPTSGSYGLASQLATHPTGCPLDEVEELRHRRLASGRNYGE